MSRVALLEPVSRIRVAEPKQAFLCQTWISIPMLWLRGLACYHKKPTKPTKKHQATYSLASFKNPLLFPHLLHPRFATIRNTSNPSKFDSLDAPTAQKPETQKQNKEKYALRARACALADRARKMAWANGSPGKSGWFPWQKEFNSRATSSKSSAARLKWRVRRLTARGGKSDGRLCVGRTRRTRAVAPISCRTGKGGLLGQAGQNLP